MLWVSVLLGCDSASLSGRFATFTGSRNETSRLCGNVGDPTADRRRDKRKKETSATPLCIPKTAHEDCLLRCDAVQLGNNIAEQHEVSVFGPT
jgi:hypothetical protein